MSLVLIGTSAAIVAMVMVVLLARRLFFVVISFSASVLLLGLLYLILGITFIAIVQNIVYLGGFLLLMVVGIRSGEALVPPPVPFTKKWAAIKSLKNIKNIALIGAMTGVLLLSAYHLGLLRSSNQYLLLGTQQHSLNQLGKHMLYTGGVLIEVIGLIILVSLLGITIAWRLMQQKAMH